MNITREHLRDYLLHAEERAVYHAYPRHMAVTLGAEHRSVLSALADSMLGGETVLHWEVECPACHAQREVNSLNDTTGTLTCVKCGNNFTAHADDEVHVTFSAHPTLRRLGQAAQDRAYLETIAHSYRPTTGHDLLTVQTFRDWAQDQPLPSGQTLDVRRVGLLFSDLSGSTALYARRGDPHAFQLVREHFDVLFEAVDHTGGAVIKTIGDSVMAAFLDGAGGLRGALASHAALADFNQRHDLSGDDRLVLKIGVHAGPTIMVTLNERLDYFGQTVNLAARMQGIAQAGEVAFSKAVFEEPDVSDLLADHRVVAAEARIKGFDQPVVVNRFTVD